MKVVIGIGGSGSSCVYMVRQTIQQLQNLPHTRVLGTSPIYENPASGGVTVATFANAAIFIETPQGLGMLWQNLHQIERRLGRIRLLKNGPRTVDLDILWADHRAKEPWLQIPHPRLLERDFALLPALDAMTQADYPCPAAWEVASKALKGLSQLRPINL